MSCRPLVPCLALLGLCAALAPAHAGATNKARLDSAVRPTAQSVRLDVDPSKHDFSGSTRIELKAAAAADSFQLNARDMRISALRLFANGQPVATSWREAPMERLTVLPARRLAPGSYALEIEFARAFDDKAVGLYRLQSGGDWYAFTQMEADDARQAFPCWDEPEFKIPWTLTLVTPKDLVVAANTPEANRTEADGRATVSFAKSPPMPSYLVAFCVGPFAATPITGLSVPGRVLTVKGQQHMTGEAVKMAPPTLAALERYFGRSYPFAKLDLVSVPEYNWGAMENPGLVTFAESALSLDPAQITNAQRRRLATYLAHEFSHMWFGDLVTMKWWDDLWLNESFASWMGDKITNEVYPEFHMPVHSLGAAQRAYAEDGQLAVRAMRQHVDENVNLNQIADELAYDKGQAVLEMTEQWIGPAAFRSGVIAYLKAHEWGNAEGADLWKALSKASGRDVSAMLSSYLDQAGCPMVTAEPLAGGQLRLSQQRCLPYGAKAPAAQVWQIPVGLEYSDGTKVYRTTVLLKDPVTTVKLETAAPLTWLHPNANERGYYRWSVPPATLTALTTVARPQLNERERMGLVHDLGALVETGALHGDDYLRTLEPFGADSSAEVVDAVLDLLQEVRVAFVTGDLRDAYARYVRTTFAPALARIGDAPQPGEDPALGELRARLMGMLGVAGADPALRARGMEMTKAMFADPAAVDPALRDVALRLAATSNDTTLYTDIQHRFETAKNPADRRRYLAALGSFHDPALVDRTLAYALDGPLRPQEVMFGFRAFDSPELMDKVWGWAQANYDRIAEKIPPMFKVYLVYFAMGCSRERATAAQAFFTQPEHAPVGTDQELAKVIEGTSDCASLRDREGARVAAMLRSLPATAGDAARGSN